MKNACYSYPQSEKSDQILASFILRFTPSMEKHGFSSQEVRNLKNNYEQISL